MSVRAHGQLRRSQVIRTFGPGSMLDLPNRAVLIGGLDEWMGVSEVIQEPRLQEKVARVLGVPGIALKVPPLPNDDPRDRTKTGIRAWEFPEWFIVQQIDTADKGLFQRSRRLVHRGDLNHGRYRDENGRAWDVVAIRFVRACRRGHIGDVAWYEFAHHGPTKCRRPLWIDERGTTGDLTEVWIRCECKAERAMSEATVTGQLGPCNGARPWLGLAHSAESCGEPNRLLIRSASNAYFPQVLSVISLPDRDDEMEEAINTLWEDLSYAESIEDLRREMRKEKFKKLLGTFDESKVFADIQRRKGQGTQAQSRSVKQAELETLLSPGPVIGNDKPNSTFHATQLPPSEWQAPWMGAVDRVLLVHRLREVSALIGFTRFESSAPDTQGELDMDVQRASIAREHEWVPAIENRGEGIFLALKRDAVEQWVARGPVKIRTQKLEEGFERWKHERPQSKATFPEAPYILLHSLSHLLICTVSLECGYPSSSIRERIYAGKEGYGILLFTGSSDAEGTLGGLVDVGRKIAHHVRMSLESGRLCSNDPVCAQRDPGTQHDNRHLQGAACHGCLLISETSCENFNQHLDRALVVPTLEASGAEFFLGA